MDFKVPVAVFAALIGMTVAELALISTAIAGAVTVTLLIGMAGAKALLIALFFQDLKDEPRALSSILLIGLGIGILLMGITFLQIHQIHI